MYKEVYNNFKKVNDSNAVGFNSLEELFAYYCKGTMFCFNDEKTKVIVYCEYYTIAEYDKIGG